MGYYTYFELKWIKEKNSVKIICDCKIIEDLNEISGYAFSKGEKEREAGSGGKIKWYEYEKDMNELSKKYPKILFELSAEGEESEDMWKARFRDGKSEIVKAIITFPKFEVVK